MTEPRCTCAAALARARRTYGHLEGRQVWATRPGDLPTSSRRGTLRVRADLPGHLYIDRGPDRSFLIHIDAEEAAWIVPADAPETRPRPGRPAYSGGEPTVRRSPS
jgi:hypothetical protein